MKRMIIYVLCVIILLMSSSCGSTNLELNATETNLELNATETSDSMRTTILTGYFDVYIYNVNVSVLINGREVGLQEAVQDGYITMDQLISDADKKVEPLVYNDGGSLEYKFDDYTMIVTYKIWGGEKHPDTIYFLPSDMGIDDLDELN